MRVALGMNHGGSALRESLLEAVAQAGYEALALGSDELDLADDYPDYYRVGGVTALE